MRVIDISHHNQGINLTKVNPDGVICKATEGTAFHDPQFATYMRAWAGKPRGAYHFLRMGPSAVLQARVFVEAVKPHPDALLVADYEPPTVGESYDKSVLVEFLAEVFRLTGKRPWVYMNLDATRSANFADVAKDHDLWLARYPTASRVGWIDKAKPSVAGWNVVCWQYTEAGRVPGYSGDLDLNVGYLSPAQWRTYGQAAASSGGASTRAKPVVVAAAVRYAMTKPTSHTWLMSVRRFMAWAHDPKIKHCPESTYRAWLKTNRPDLVAYTVWRMQGSKGRWPQVPSVTTAELTARMERYGYEVR